MTEEITVGSSTVVLEQSQIGCCHIEVDGDVVAWDLSEKKAGWELGTIIMELLAKQGRIKTPRGREAVIEEERKFIESYEESK